MIFGHNKPAVYTLNCRGRLLVIDKPVVMGILNATPDSFYTKGRNSLPEEQLLTAGQMISEGVTILDIGGASTRPGAGEISQQEESDRVLPVIETIRSAFPDTYISVDTYRADVARQAVASGADIVNDVSAGELDDKMIATVASLHVPYIAMHMQGKPQNMQQEPYYENVVQEVMDYFIAKCDALAKAGIKDVIVDPGFGFGKNMEHNYHLLQSAGVLKILDKPMLAGLSRKSMINKLLKTQPETALNGTTVLNTIALQKGFDILRVHDVKEAMQAITVVEYLRSLHNSF